MKNQITFKQNPETLILDPYQDEGLQVLAQPSFLWRPRDAALIRGFAVSEHAEMNARIEDFLTNTEKNRMFSQAVEFNSVPVVLTDALFKKSFATVKGRALISGAAGIRLLNRYVWMNEADGAEPEKDLIAYFDHRQQANAGKTGLPVFAGDLPKDTPFAIECRNTFNFYHFVTESLCQLCLVAEAAVEGPIYLHYPNSDDKTRLFTFAFIDALFPELADRVVFQRAPVHHDLVVSGYNFACSYYQMPVRDSAAVDRLAPSKALWKGRTASRGSHGVLNMNAVDSNLFKLRERAMAAIAGKDFSHLPKRFWVGRDADQSRQRDMKGEAELLEFLKLFGFQSVAFERLAPLEQIAIMANAEMMVSYHGAGFTNMLFANPNAHVIELGTLQTAVTRWGDFWALAHVSQCKFLSFFADYNKPDPLVDPSFADDGIVPVHLSASGLAQIMAFIVSLLGQIPKLTRADDVATLGSRLMQVGAMDQARNLFALHEGMEEGHVDLSLLLADCLGHYHCHAEELAALYSAYRADPARWSTLIRVIWCARTLNDLETVRVGLTVLREGFPDRFEAFVKDRPWFQKQLDAPQRRVAL